MKETIKIDGVQYIVQNVNTGISTIAFEVDDPNMGDVETLFRNTQAFEIGNENGEIYGSYPNVEFESLTIHADERITVAMHILNKIEVQIRELQAAQTEMKTAQTELKVTTAEHDEVIAAMMFGGEE